MGCRFAAGAHHLPHARRPLARAQAPLSGAPASRSPPTACTRAGQRWRRRERPGPDGRGGGGGVRGRGGVAHPAACRRRVTDRRRGRRRRQSLDCWPCGTEHTTGTAVPPLTGLTSGGRQMSELGTCCGTATTQKCRPLHAALGRRDQAYLCQRTAVSAHRVRPRPPLLVPIGAVTTTRVRRGRQLDAATARGAVNGREQPHHAHPLERPNEPLSSARDTAVGARHTAAPFLATGGRGSTCHRRITVVAAAAVVLSWAVAMSCSPSSAWDQLYQSTVSAVPLMAVIHGCWE